MYHSLSSCPVCIIQHYSWSFIAICANCVMHGGIAHALVSDSTKIGIGRMVWPGGVAVGSPSRARPGQT